MSDAVSFDEYLGSLTRLTPHVDPTAATPESNEIREAAYSLRELESIDLESLTEWVRERPKSAPVLGLIVGLSQEKLKNSLRHQFDTQGWVTLARQRSGDLVQWLDETFNLVELARQQLPASYDIADVLVARAGSRVTATRAGVSGRSVEDAIEAIAQELGLPYLVRGRFTGRNGRDAPGDLIIPNTDDPLIVVAAKGFDSTGSKLTDAVREIEEMAEVRRPRQFVLAVVDGIGWKSRQSDLRKIHHLWTSQQIDGMYTLATLQQFREDIREAAELRGLL